MGLIFFSFLSFSLLSFLLLSLCSLPSPFILWGRGVHFTLPTGPVVVKEKKKKKENYL